MQALLALALSGLLAMPAAASRADQTIVHPGVTIEVKLPVTVEADNRSFLLEVKVNNITDAENSFEAVLWHGGAGWSGEDERPVASPNSEVYKSLRTPGGRGVYHWWKGNLASGESAIYQLQSYSGTGLGAFVFFRGWFLTTMDHIPTAYEQSVLVVEPASGPPPPRPQPAPVQVPASRARRRRVLTSSAAVDEGDSPLSRIALGSS